MLAPRRNLTVGASDFHIQADEGKAREIKTSFPSGKKKNANAPIHTPYTRDLLELIAPRNRPEKGLLRTFGLNWIPYENRHPKQRARAERA